MCVKVTCVSRDADGTITHIGGSADDGSMRWGLTRAEAIQRIESNEWSFFVARPAADPVPVIVRTISGVKILTTAPDETQTNNLDLLPICNLPISGTDPQFPLSIPGPRQPTLVQLQGPARGGGAVVIPPDAKGHFKIPGWNTTKALKRLRLTCNIPFPANLEVYVERDPTQPDYVEADHMLTKIDSTLPAQVRALEDQGKGWYDWILMVPDASFPRRFTPVIMPVGIPKAFGTASGLTLYVRNVSYNRYCAGPSVPLSVVVYQTKYAPTREYPPSGNSTGKVTKPSREYKTGAFSAWQPGVKGVGQSMSKGTDKFLEVKSSSAVGMAGWPQFGVYTNPAATPPTMLCQPVGFAVLAGTGNAGGGVGFSSTGEFGVALAIMQPNVPGRAGNVLFRFTKLGAPSAQPMDVEGTLTTPNATVTPRILFDPAEQVALVVDANRFGSYTTSPGRARLLDLGHGASTLHEFAFDGSTLSAAVSKLSDGSYEAVITTNVGQTKVALPKN